LRNYNKDTYYKYFDEAWKKIIERFFPYMLRFFIPHLYQDADFSNGFIFLDKELEQLSRKSKKGEAFNIKLRLIRSMYEKGYSQDEIRAIFEFIDWIITLNDKEEGLIREEIEKLEGVKKVPYVTSIERIGRREEKKEGILEVLDVRFGSVPLDITDHINDIENDKKLKKLLRLAVSCSSIDEFKQSLNGNSQK
jgi:hypothetical protein